MKKKNLKCQWLLKRQHSENLKRNPKMIHFKIYQQANSQSHKASHSKVFNNNHEKLQIDYSLTQQKSKK